MTFHQAAPDGQSPTPIYPASGIRGLGVVATTYPLPIRAHDPQPSGLGVSVAIEKSIASYNAVNVPELDQDGNYRLDHSTYEGGIHYGLPTGQFWIDGELDYGLESYRTTLPSSLLIPSVDYRYVGIGAHAAVTGAGGKRLAIGGRYLDVLSAGAVSDATSYGPGKTSGFALDATIHVPLGDLLFVDTTFVFRRVNLELDRSGAVAMQTTISAISDDAFSGSARIGVSF
jgi:hypothetical protein